jgi:hypothetical protein
MNDEQLQVCWNEIKHSPVPSPSYNPQLEMKMIKEMTTHGPRRRFRKRILTVSCCLLGLCVLGGIIADNIVMATPFEQTDGTTIEQAESLLDYLMRHVHEHARQIHRHFH